MSDDLIARLRRAVAEGRVPRRLLYEAADALERPTITDGMVEAGARTITPHLYYMFDELYEYRMLYNAHAAHGWLAQGIPVVKSWRHADGTECFGGGWFIVTATLPAGQVSNHYPASAWGLFKVPEVDLPPEWDGHTPLHAADRLRVAAEQANPQPIPTGLEDDDE